MRLGSDPECLLVDTAGNFKSVCGLLDGHDKWNPLQVPDMEAGFTFQEDNVCIEFGIPPASTSEQFKHHIKAVQQRFLAEHKHLKFSNLSCVVMPDSEMKHPAAHIFGCEPDFNAWNGKVNKKPAPPTPNMRIATANSIDNVFLVCYGCLNNLSLNQFKFFYKFLDDVIPTPSLIVHRNVGHCWCTRCFPRGWGCIYDRLTSVFEDNLKHNVYPFWLETRCLLTAHLNRFYV